MKAALPSLNRDVIPELQNKVYKLFPATYNDNQKVVACYQRFLVPGYDIGHIEVVYNKSMNDKFILH